MNIHMCRYLLLITIWAIGISVCTELSGISIATNGPYESLITIHEASSNDLESILALDASISYEYFKPLFLLYPEYEGKEHEVEKLLAAELETDATWFADCIAMKDDQRLFMARHDNCVGFVACHKQDGTIVVIDLLMIDAAYRAKGIGKQLIKTCINAFPEASTCMLVVLDKNLQACAAYEKIGFVLITEKPAFMQEKYPNPRYLCYRLP